MHFQDSIRDLAQAHAPCIVVACRLEERKDAQETAVNVGVSPMIDGLRAEQVVMVLAALKLAHMGLCERLARQAGIPEHQLHNMIAEQINASRMTDNMDTDG